MTVLYTGKPAPLDGKRQLSAREAALRAKAMACVRSPKSTQCQGQVHVGLFFDGTGNNDSWVEDGHSATQRARNKHSNVARLFDAHLSEPENGFFRYYMPGVGTPFSAVGDTSSLAYDVAGMGFGYKGADRINYGIISIFNAVSQYLTGAPLVSVAEAGGIAASISTDARGPVSTEGAMRWTALTALEEKLSAMMATQQRRVNQISVSIFGFSRGAAESRACAFWLAQICERRGGGMHLAGVPIRIGFMGLFDTVAAVGLGDALPLADGHMAWADGTQSIHPAVEECAHYIALHEQRASFPLEAAVGRGNVGYPGMHSDVGGGYCPGDQGKAMPEWGDSPQLSQIPLIDMHFAAIKAGVPMKTIEEIRSDATLAKSFATDAKLLGAYNRWLASHGIPAADICDFTQAHTRQYLRWRGVLQLGGGAGIKAHPSFQRVRSKQDQADLLEADRQFGHQLKWMLECRATNSTLLGSFTSSVKESLRLTLPMGRVLIAPSKLTSEEEKFLSVAADSAMPPTACAELFADYVHDSRAGFRILGGHEPVLLTGGYFRYRHVFKEAVHAEAKVFGWANEAVSGSKVAAHALMEVINQLCDQASATYQMARRKIAATGRSAINSVSSIYRAAQDKVIRSYMSAERELQEQLAHRYAEVKGAVEDFNSPEARQRRQWAVEAAEFERMRVK